MLVDRRSQSVPEIGRDAVKLLGKQPFAEIGHRVGYGSFVVGAGDSSQLALGLKIGLDARFRLARIFHRFSAVLAQKWPPGLV
jgi:hypothetical protein